LIIKLRDYGFFHIFLCRLLSHELNCNFKEQEPRTSFLLLRILGAAMKLICGISFAFDSKSLALWIEGSFPFLSFSFSFLFFFSFCFLFSLLAAHASSLVLGSEVIILVFFNILNNYKSEMMI